MKAHFSVLAAAWLCAALPAAAFNHELIVNPLRPGAYDVACTNIAQDPALIAQLGGTAEDFWEGRSVNDQPHYIDQILAAPSTAFQFDITPPNDQTLYTNHAGIATRFVAIVCHPTPGTNPDPAYALPQTGELVPHMQPAGQAPKLLPRKFPLLVYSHGLGGSPIGPGYLGSMVAMASFGYVVGAVFHGDPRFSRIRVENLSDAVYVLTQYSSIVEMEAMRPLSLKTMTDLLLADPNFGPAIDTDRIAGFGASLGGQAMINLLGANMTTSITLACNPTVQDPRIKAAVGYVPYAGQSFLPAFCNGNGGAENVNRPFLAMSGTADTTAPIGMMEMAMNHFHGSRYLVELIDGQHELRPEDAGDLFTWMVTFLDAYLQVDDDPGAMARFIRMNGVNGGRADDVKIDVHVPFALQPGEVTVKEFQNPSVDRYALAWTADDIARISGTSGWSATGQSFTALAQPPANLLSRMAAVCRFSLPLADGTRSQFVTASWPECNGLRAQGAWQFDGYGFTIVPARADGACPAGYLGVNRVYNNGYATNTSNHRFTTSDSTARAMVARGWHYDGVTMCSLP